MEQQLIEMLDLLKQGLAELPSIGSDVWTVMVNGTRIGGVVTILISVAIIMIYIKIMLVIAKEYKKAFEADTWYNSTDGAVSALLFGGALGVILTMVLIYTLYNGAMDLLVPEYTIIKDVIGSLGG